MSFNRLVVGSVLAGLATLVAAGAARAQPQVLVNTTAWIVPIEPVHCVAVGAPCGLNAAIERGQSSFGAVVSACFTPGDPRCLQTDDPHYDPATGKWHLQLADPFSPFVITQDDMELDFTRNIDGWSGPQDNKIVLELATEQQETEVFVISGSGNQFAGFEFEGDVSTTYMAVRAVAEHAAAVGNILGPGLILAGHQEGVGMRLRGDGVSGTVVRGNWCGIEGDGTTIAPMSEHCVELTEGANANRIGGSGPGDRNFFAANLDVAVSVSDPASRDNMIEGNTFGLDVTGKKAAGSATGIALIRQATGTKVFGNIISGHEIDGILADNTSTEFGRITTRIEDNWIGVDAEGLKEVGNGNCGIMIRGLSKNVVVKNNRIWWNQLCGITITGANARDNTVTGNSLTRNHGHALVLSQGANQNVPAPTIARAEAERLTGSACARCTVEIFSDPLDEAESFEGTTQAGADGAWSFDKPGGFAFRFVTATATDGRNTSGLSEPKQVERGARPTRTPTGMIGRPTPTVTRTPDVVRVSIRLPWAGKKAVR